MPPDPLPRESPFPTDLLSSFCLPCLSDAPRVPWCSLIPHLSGERRAERDHCCLPVAVPVGISGGTSADGCYTRFASGPLGSLTPGLISQVPLMTLGDRAVGHEVRGCFLSAPVPPRPAGPPSPSHLCRPVSAVVPLGPLPTQPGRRRITFCEGGRQGGARDDLSVRPPTLSTD